MGFLVRLIQDNYKGRADRAVLQLLDKSSRTSWKTWGLWVTATVPSAFTLYFICTLTIFDYLWWWWCILVLGIIGVSQWLALRKYVDLFGYWVIATLLGAGSAVLLSWALSVKMEPSIFIPLGVFVGLGQWLVLRNRVYGSGWWIAASIIGWSGLVFRISYDVLLSGITAIIFLGVVTGTALIWLLRHPKPVN